MLKKSGRGSGRARCQKRKSKIALTLQAGSGRAMCISGQGHGNPYRDAAVSDSQMKSIGVLLSRRLNIVENALGLL